MEKYSTMQSNGVWDLFRIVLDLCGKMLGKVVIINMKQDQLRVDKFLNLGMDTFIYIEMFHNNKLFLKGYHIIHIYK